MVDQRLIMRLTHNSGKYTDVVLGLRQGTHWTIVRDNNMARIQFEEALNQMVLNEVVSDVLMPKITFYYESEKWDWVDPSLDATHEVIP